MSSEDLASDKQNRMINTKVFADVNKQISYMKTDHVRGKIFARREAEGTEIFSDSDSNGSVKQSPPEGKRKNSILKKSKLQDYEDDITPYDSVSNAGRFLKQDRQNDFDEDDDDEETSGDIADDIVKKTMNQYRVGC